MINPDSKEFKKFQDRLRIFLFFANLAIVIYLIVLLIKG